MLDMVLHIGNITEKKKNALVEFLFQCRNTNNKQVDK